jgi:hypothetical protein
VLQTQYTSLWLHVPLVHHIDLMKRYQDEFDISCDYALALRLTVNRVICNLQGEREWLDEW